MQNDTLSQSKSLTQVLAQGDEHSLGGGGDASPPMVPLATSMAQCPSDGTPAERCTMRLSKRRRREFA